MFETRDHGGSSGVAVRARSMPELFAKNRTMFYAVATFLVLMGALFGGDGKHPILSAFIAGLGAGVAFTTWRLSRR
jgi:hypothetical protein